jgi:hypothetical protein
MKETWLGEQVDALANSGQHLGTRALVAEWCRRFNIDDGSNVIETALSLEGQFVDAAYGVYRRAHDLRTSGLRNLPKLDHQDFEAALKNEQEMETRYIVLLALFLAAGGYYLCSRKFPSPLGLTPPPPTPQRMILVLVVNAARTDVLERLKAEGKVPMGIGKELYLATQALWMGTKAGFELSPLRSWFADEKAATVPSEYDVQLVRVDISVGDEGFLPGANQMARIDAFARLALTTPWVELSPRVPSEAYGITEVYSR